MEEVAWEDFGQKVDLTARIREILLNYPEGTPILKELVQNADDAKATSIRFCLDHRVHSSEGLLDPKLQRFQGPALLVYNNATFSEHDFQSISRIGDSVKRKQTGKTGRFGIGFNSCYHLTDLPSFVSGSHLVIFDPHCAYLPNVSASNPGKKINFVENRSATKASSGQFAPYQGWGCDLTAGRPWPGTLFRLPLRTPELAGYSNISKQTYDVAKLQGVLQQLKDEAPEIMLFLKNIECIEVYEWLPGNSEPTCAFTCAVSNSSPELAHNRSMFARCSLASGGDPSADPRMVAQPQGSTFLMDLRVTRHGVSDYASSAHRTFLVSQLKGGGASTELAANLTKQFGVPLVPWAAVAAEITPTALPSSKDGSESAEPRHSATAAAAARGRAYCFLPLPALTGLPVHVNAFFELSSNRRDIWYGADMSGLGAARAQWNASLLRHVAADAYVALLEAAKAHLGPSPAYAALWPSQVASAAHWQDLVNALYECVGPRPLAFTLPTLQAAGGQEGNPWLPPSASLLPDVAVQKSPTLGRALAKLGVPLLGLPMGVVQMMATLMPVQHRPRVISPDRVRRLLQAQNKGQQQEQQQLQQRVPQFGHLDVTSEAPEVLSYCLTGEAKRGKK
ncbi:hypothetical protein DUNSADRAFT_16062 [Dunaliella salina]|uniref:Sacsin/Nov domain-containing protein n=1 Tax=Dunaliella salina TaxID=3046 RepID=A0ABQ7G4A9_DUNSA|nr:hypothetical protein DUNSADRAFT_16062 [Dunaliella salina]|eukprot:KAF5829451.1 hypothetical protein DUNSADRAFT_16062 [Dunaliella salina]